jgi:hypothetical protein
MEKLWLKNRMFYNEINFTFYNDMLRIFYVFSWVSQLPTFPTESYSWSSYRQLFRCFFFFMIYMFMTLLCMILKCTLNCSNLSIRFYLLADSKYMQTDSKYLDSFDSERQFYSDRFREFQKISILSIPRLF